MQLLVFVCLVLCLHSTFASNDIFRSVAHSFTAGYQRADPFELSPLQVKHQQLMEASVSLAHQNTLPTNSPVLIEQEELVSPPPQPDDAKVMEELKVALAKQEEEATKPVALAETESHIGRRGIIDTVASISNKVQNAKNKLTGKYNPSNAQLYEDCMACRMVWKQVENGYFKSSLC